MLELVRGERQVRGRRTTTNAKKQRSRNHRGSKEAERIETPRRMGIQQVLETQLRVRDRVPTVPEPPERGTEKQRSWSWEQGKNPAVDATGRESRGCGRGRRSLKGQQNPTGGDNGENYEQRASTGTRQAMCRMPGHSADGAHGRDEKLAKEVAGRLDVLFKQVQREQKHKQQEAARGKKSKAQRADVVAAKVKGGSQKDHQSTDEGRGNMRASREKGNSTPSCNGRQQYSTPMLEKSPSRQVLQEAQNTKGGELDKATQQVEPMEKTAHG